MTGLTLDTGALIALERRDARMTRVFAAAVADGVALHVPMPVVTEWWRAPSAARRRILLALSVEPTTLAVAKAAGEALAIVRRGPSAVDAIVMASAASRGDLVYTSDVEDLEKLSAVFRTVRVLRV